MIRHSMRIQYDMFDTLWFVHSVESGNNPALTLVTVCVEYKDEGARADNKWVCVL